MKQTLKKNAIFWGPVLLAASAELIPKQYSTARLLGLGLGTAGTALGLIRAYKKGLGK